MTAKCSTSENNVHLFWRVGDGEYCKTENNSFQREDDYILNLLTNSIINNYFYIIHSKIMKRKRTIV